MPAGPAPERSSSRTRADAVRNAAAILEGAKAVFAESGVDAPMREIAARAGVGVATIYRSYPQRSDLIVAVFRRELEATAAEAERLGREYPPREALRRWAAVLGSFVVTKRGFSGALHSGDPAYVALREQLLGVLAPPVQALLDAGAAAGELRHGVRAEDLIRALSLLTPEGDDDAADGLGPMASVLLDGLVRTA
jgi:AcrR family transcriptional regulator